MNAPLAAPSIQTARDGRRIYTPGGATLAAFLKNRSELAIIRGPIGSGKTLACCQRLFQHAVEQREDSRGKRRSRWFVIRESYPKIETTAMLTWLEWFPERVYGKLFTGSKPYLHEVRVGNIELDVYFGAIDDLGGDSVFGSLEPTGWWWNELSYAGMRPFFTAHGRVGRYPPVVEGGSRWSGSIADTNAMPENHWLPMLTGEVDLPDDMSLDERRSYEVPPDMAYFVQPPAVLEIKDAAGLITGFRINRDGDAALGIEPAENLRFLTQPHDEDGLGETYYRRAMAARPNRWVQTFLGNKIIPWVDGDAVWPSFDPDVHVSKIPLEPVPGIEVSVGLDFGRRPAAVFTQKIGAQVQVQFEAAMDNAGATKFAPRVREILAQHYPWIMPGGRNTAGLKVWGDPKGDDGTQTDERTAYDIFAAAGLHVAPAPVKQNNIRTRIEAVEYLLDRAPNGRPALLISPRCPRLKMAMGGGYRYPKERPAPLEDRKPIKDKYSDICDALQYDVLGGGAGASMIGRGRDNRPQPVSTRPPFQSRRRVRA